ncbi:hypothetical protein LJC23_05655 [Desulfovibrio sp. OttesenSCG-928-I05]|nr:hypothetical protein [Desulfovibrio sp. OttesenSCG-928-I05]
MKKNYFLKNSKNTIQYCHKTQPEQGLSGFFRLLSAGAGDTSVQGANKRVTRHRAPERRSLMPRVFFPRTY